MNSSVWQFLSFCEAATEMLISIYFKIINYMAIFTFETKLNGAKGVVEVKY